MVTIITTCLNPDTVYVVHLTSLSGQVVSTGNKACRIRLEVVVAKSGYDLGICLEVLRETMKSLSQNFPAESRARGLQNTSLYGITNRRNWSLSDHAVLQVPKFRSNILPPFSEMSFYLLVRSVCLHLTFSQHSEQ
jgi:hypothetical protein